MTDLTPVSADAARRTAGLSWPFLDVVDEHGAETGWVFLNGPIIDPAQHDQFAELRRLGYRMVGTSSYVSFPRLDSGDPIDYESLCEAWCHCFREPQAFLSSYYPRALISLSDFVDPRLVEPTRFAPSSDDDRLDFVYVGGFDDWKREIKNWPLAAHCIPRLCDDLGLRCLIVGAATPEIEAVTGVTFSEQLPWPDLLRRIAGARFLFVPNLLDPSPRIISEALCLDVPVVVNRQILGGWHYVNRFTGIFFNDPTDVVAAVRNCLARRPSPRPWFVANHGPCAAGRRLLRLLSRVDPSLRRHSWLCPGEQTEVPPAPETG